NDAEADRAMTPLIDMVFLLLIFFVCASVGQIRESLLPTELAAGSIESPQPRHEPPPLGELWLRLSRNDAGRTVIEVNERRIADVRVLAATLRDLAGVTTEIPVILDIDPDVPLGDMIAVYDAANQAGFDSIDFAVEPSAVRP
ncbi:MAG: ExbD/TolR family protein, partial [Planctomycetaceae bacterium]